MVLPSIPPATDNRVDISFSLRGSSTLKVSMFSFICSKLDMPERVTVIWGMLWRNRKAQAVGVSSGRRAARAFRAVSGREHSRPPRRGSMTHTGMLYSFSSSTFSLQPWKVQST